MWDAVGDGEFTADTLADLLCREYEVEHDRALADSRVVLTQWDEAGLLC
ncbi:MAG: PqqD family protein [Bacteroidaceae bacterium]